MSPILSDKQPKPVLMESIEKTPGFNHLPFAIFIGALIIVPVILAVICSLTSPNPELRHGSYVNSIKLVKRDAGLDKITMIDPQSDKVFKKTIVNNMAIDKWLARQKEVAYNRTPIYRQKSGSAARDSAGQPKNTNLEADQGGNGVYATHELLLLDCKQRSLILKYDDLAGQPLDAEAIWNPKYVRFAAWIRFDDFLELGMVEPDSGKFIGIKSIKRPQGDLERLPKLLWHKDKLLIYCQTENKSHRLVNCILEINPANGSTKTIFTEEQWDPSRGSIRCLLLSPDERWLAFDRFRESTKIATGGACAGLWLIDLTSGKCDEITHESEPNYHHRLVGWEGNDLLFLRRMGQDRAHLNEFSYQYDLYRLRIGLSNSQGGGERGRSLTGG